MSQKKKSLSITAAVAVGLCASAFADETPLENLALSTNAWFSISETAPGATSQWTPSDDYAWIGTEGSKVVEFDTDLTAASGEPGLLYAPSVSVTSDIQTLEFDLECAPVLAANLPSSIDSAKAGFAVKKTVSGDTTTLKYVAYANNAFVELDNAEPPTAGTRFSLRVIIDDRGTGAANVRYAVKTNDSDYVDLCNGGSTNLYKAAGYISGIAFRGTGLFKTLKGDQNSILSETISVDSKTVTVAEAEMNAFKGDIQAPGATSQTVAQYLATTDSGEGSRTVLQNYELGLRVANSEGTASELIDGGKILMKGDATAASNTEIKLKLNAIPPQSGATITYQLYGSDDGSAWTAVGTPQTDANGLSIPISGTDIKVYKSYKVKAIIAD